MATNYPTSLDNFTNPASTDLMNSVTVPHNEQHANANDAIEALQAKVGVDSSAVTTSLDYKVAQLESDVAGLVTGKILQVVTGTTSTEVATTAGTMVTTGLTATITPTSASSTILAFMSAPITIEAASTFLSTTIYRGTIASGTNLATPDNFLGLTYSGSTTGSVRQQVTTFALDSPATTSATTYTGAFNSTNGKVCKGSNHPARMILLEVSA